jgi:hypothetical protein
MCTDEAAEWRDPCDPDRYISYAASRDLAVRLNLLVSALDPHPGGCWWHEGDVRSNLDGVWQDR